MSYARNELHTAAGPQKAAAPLCALEALDLGLIIDVVVLLGSRDCEDRLA